MREITAPRRFLVTRWSPFDAHSAAAADVRGGGRGVHGWSAGRGGKGPDDDDSSDSDSDSDSDSCSDDEDDDKLFDSGNNDEDDDSGGGGGGGGKRAAGKGSSDSPAEKAKQALKEKAKAVGIVWQDHDEEEWKGPWQGARGDYRSVGREIFEGGDVEAEDSLLGIYDFVDDIVENQHTPTIRDPFDARGKFHRQDFKIYTGMQQSLYVVGTIFFSFFFAMFFFVVLFMFFFLFCLFD